MKELNENAGVLFLNESNTKTRRPDFGGEMKVDGKIVKIVGFMKESSNGQKYIYFEEARVQKKDKLSDWMNR